MKLSIIVPVYNLEKYIAITLDSLLAVRFSDDYEILIINDGSKDKSEEIVKHYQLEYDCIRLFTIENLGVSNARNVGIQKASGEYITFVDGDDTVDPDFFDIAVRELDEGGYDFVQGNYLVVDQNGAHRQQYVKHQMVLTERDEMILYFLGPEKLIHNAVWGKVFRADAIRHVLFDIALTVSEDQKFVFDILRKAKKIMLMNHHAINYVQRGTSSIHTYNESKEKNKIIVLEYFCGQVTQSEIMVNLKQHQIQVYQGLYWHYTLDENPQADEVRRELLRIYTKEIRNVLETKSKILLFMLKYARFLLDVYIRRG